MTRPFSRRDFLAASGVAGLGTFLNGCATTLVAADASVDDKPAILGGKAMTMGGVPSWPVLQGEEEKLLLEVLNSKNWCCWTMKFKVAEFEKKYAEMNGAKHCIATNGGTSALINTLAALEVGPGDEVITSPFTFVATINSILSHYALPTVADVDIESAQIDPAKADAACTENTAVLMPVHIGGLPADMDGFMELGKKRKLPVVEDACQAHLGKWRDKYLGSIGTAGCFSFQVTKNLACGDGGAVLTSDDALADKIYACHNNGRGRTVSSFMQNAVRGRNNRMIEFAGAILLAQMAGIEKYAEIREENGLYLNKLLSEIPGVVPAKRYAGVTQSAWHLYMFRIEKEKFGLDRDTFIKALSAEKIPGGVGYSAVDWTEYTKKIYSTRAAGRLYSKKFLDDWAERVGDLPKYKRLASEAVWFGQNLLVGPKKNMDIIADAIRRIQKNAAQIKG
ncbi:MAG: DegT/DnrJ/EryC1/StrS family aminotransferase [Planctomycetaceae bacterium]|nr:DegT/DnrJ/EryC1/StrS family aminotransferase [Planctomycetaceae bacterium]